MGINRESQWFALGPWEGDRIQRPDQAQRCAIKWYLIAGSPGCFLKSPICSVY